MYEIAITIGIGNFQAERAGEGYRVITTNDIAVTGIIDKLGNAVAEAYRFASHNHRGLQESGG